MVVWSTLLVEGTSSLTFHVAVAKRFMPLTNLGVINCCDAKSVACPVKWAVAPPSTIHLSGKDVVSNLVDTE